jgi:hypothetical protein
MFAPPEMVLRGISAKANNTAKELMMIAEICRFLNTSVNHPRNPCNDHQCTYRNVGQKGTQGIAEC